MRKLLVPCLLVGCSGAPGNPPAMNAPSLPQGVFSVGTIEPGQPIDDLAPLAGLVGSARVVGLGESVHTSGGFTEAKARLWRWMVETQGFRALGIEVSRAEADVAGGFVASCQGSSTEAARHLDVWADDHLRDLLDWMCQWNATHPDDRVHLFGFDVRQPWADAPSLRGFLAAAAPSDAGDLWSKLATCDGVDAVSATDYQQKYGLGRSISQAEHDQCASGLAALGSYLDAHESALAQATSQGALDLARIDLASFGGWQGYRFALATDGKRAQAARDSAMAEVFARSLALHFPSLRAVAWAHDDHVAADAASIAGGLLDGADGMGSILSKQLGADYVAIAVTGWDVELNWPGVGCGPATPPSADSVEALLHSIGSAYLLVDFQPRASGSPFLTPGADYGFGIGERLIPSQQFRAALYLGRSPAANSLLWQCK